MISCTKLDLAIITDKLELRGTEENELATLLAAFISGVQMSMIEIKKNVNEKNGAFTIGLNLSLKTELQH